MGNVLFSFVATTLAFFAVGMATQAIVRVLVVIKRKVELLDALALLLAYLLVAYAIWRFIVIFSIAVGAKGITY